MFTLRIRRFLMLIAVFCSALLFSVPTQAAPVSYSGPSVTDRCQNRKQIEDWRSRRAIEAKGFKFDIVGKQASVDFGRTMSLNVASNPSSSAYTASRMTEIDSNLPIDQRVKCWQATPKKDVVVEFRVRFKQAIVPEGLTENLILWNAPLPPKGDPEPMHPATAIGVSRNRFDGTPHYQAVIAQDLSLPQSIRSTPPMPAWLQATEWHRVRITISQQIARVEVAQGAHPFTLVAQSTLLHPAEPLGFEFSVDNEAVPGSTAPVKVSDSLEASYLKLGLVPAHDRCGVKSCVSHK